MFVGCVLIADTFSTYILMKSNDLRINIDSFTYGLLGLQADRSNNTDEGRVTVRECNDNSELVLLGQFDF